MNKKPKLYTGLKNKILTKGRLLFWENGYDGTSMKDIAHSCGFEPGNIYNYFKSKEELLYEVLREEMTRAVSAAKHLETDSDSTPTERLRSLIKISIDVNLGQRRTSRLLFDAELNSFYVQSRKKTVESLVDFSQHVV